jgi:hypothetical protein
MQHNGNSIDPARDDLIGSDEQNETGSKDKRSDKDERMRNEPLPGEGFFF